MRLVTVQIAEHAEPQLAAGRLSGGDGRQVDPDFLRAYRWMMAQMAKRLMGPVSGDFPVWAWLEGSSQARAGLAGWGPPIGTRMLKITFEPKGGRALLSDFHAWHAVLNDWALDERDDLDQEQKEASWNRIFDPAWCVENGWSFHGQVQACVDGVPSSEIVKIEEFLIPDEDDEDNLKDEPGD